MPSINSIGKAEQIAQLAKQGAKEISAALTKDGHHSPELVSAPVETLRAYAGIDIAPMKIAEKAAASGKQEEQSAIDSALAKLKDCVSKQKKEYTVPTVQTNYEYNFLPQINEASFAGCYDHISRLEISLKSGINGGHKKEIYTSLHSAIKETVQNIKNRTPGRIKGHIQKYLKENEIIESVSDISPKEGTIHFNIKLENGKVCQGIMQENGSIIINRPDGSVLNIEKSDTMKKNVFKEIYDPSKSTSLLKEVRSRIKCDFTIQSAEVDGDNIILGLGDCKNLKMGDKVLDTKNLKFKLIRDEENGLGMYHQKYEYDYIDATGKMHHGISEMALPKTIVDGGELDKVFHFVKTTHGKRKHLLHMIPNTSEKSTRNSFALKYNNHYYMLDCCKEGAQLDIHSIYPMQNTFMSKMVSEAHRVPDMTSYINAMAV